MMNAVTQFAWTLSDADDCPVADTLASLAGKWKPRMLHALSLSDLHFLELVRTLPGVSRKVITAQLKDLVDAGLVLRQPQNDARSRVLYSLSASGRSLAQILAQISVWSQQHR